jgi:hypothetical protein
VVERPRGEFRSCDCTETRERGEKLSDDYIHSSSSSVGFSELGRLVTSSVTTTWARCDRNMRACGARSANLPDWSD